MNRIEKIIWAAGFMDGDGCFCISKGISGPRCAIIVAQKISRPLNILKELFGGSLSIGNGEHSDMGNWTVSGKDAFAACSILYPYLIFKKKQAKLIMEFGNLTPHKPGLRLSDEVRLNRVMLMHKCKRLNQK